MIARIVAWLSSLRWWVARQAFLRAEVVRLRRQIVAERADHHRQLVEIDEQHRKLMASLRLDNADLRSECIRLDREVAEFRNAARVGEGVADVSAVARD